MVYIRNHCILSRNIQDECVQGVWYTHAQKVRRMPLRGVLLCGVPTKGLGRASKDVLLADFPVLDMCASRSAYAVQDVWHCILLLRKVCYR